VGEEGMPGKDHWWRYDPWPEKNVGKNVFYEKILGANLF